jgi:hypothetical protein
MGEIFTSGNKNTVLERWYQWEFLRRNPDYQQDFAAFHAEFGAWFRNCGFWFDQDVRYSKEETCFFLSRIAPRCREICRKWQILEPLSPSWEFDKFYGLYEYRENHFTYLPTAVSSIRAGGSALGHRRQEVYVLH